MTWNGEPDDYAAYKAGWVFATQDDAEKALSNVAKELKTPYILRGQLNG
nr:MAG TPA: hypothetical protein [Caudoviricetes sp.]